MPWRGLAWAECILGRCCTMMRGVSTGDTFAHYNMALFRLQRVHRKSICPHPQPLLPFCGELNVLVAWVVVVFFSALRPQCPIAVG